MRELKFRAWNKANNEMIDTFALLNNDIIAPLIFRKPGYKMDLVWMQYIGIKDSKGKDIYEGDIVAWMSDPRSGVFDCKMVVEIRVEQLGVLQSVPAINNTSEVIGNIYENKQDFNDSMEEEG